ncbi:unnamed protein product [Paramecium pentaurelia]|uniref:Uncharacterized protein n=1 Tax=Paramecium pentaurelia TaxID=43138 RepID=A0A8S1V3R3_9CILI|nr:unnamed protein product [Paramecium pentaurelia]
MNQRVDNVQWYDLMQEIYQIIVSNMISSSGRPTDLMYSKQRIKQVMDKQYIGKTMSRFKLNGERDKKQKRIDRRWMNEILILEMNERFKGLNIWNSYYKGEFRKGIINCRGIYVSGNRKILSGYFEEIRNMN